MKRDRIWGVGALYPGKPSCPVVDVAADDRNQIDEENTMNNNNLADKFKYLIKGKEFSSSQK